MSTAPSPTFTARRPTSILVAVIVTGTVVVLAQVVEWAVLRTDARSAFDAQPFHDVAHRHIVGPLYLELTFNHGSSFSMMSGGGWLPVLLAVLVTVAMAVVVWRAERWSVLVGGALALGGGLSNLIDRVHHGAVADYLWTSFWPTFNVADAAVTVGIATMVVGLLLPRHEVQGA